MNIIIAFIWIGIGILEAYLGISAYVKYSSGGLFMMMVPEQIEVKNIFFGAVSIWIGIGLLKNPKKQVKMIFSLPFWVLFFIAAGTIRLVITFNHFDLECFLILDYVFILLSYFTLKEMKKSHIIGNIKLREFIFFNWVFIIIGGLIINSLIFLFAELIPYDTFIK